MTKVLVVHVPYEFRGGEDSHVETLVEAYRKIGVEPVLYPRKRTPDSHSVFSAGRSLLPNHIPADLAELFAAEKPSFVHVHNAFPTLGPGFFEWLIAEKIPAVMTIHNHRFYCANGLAFRDGKICKDCFGTGTGWRAVAHKCNSSLAKSAYHAAAVTRMGAGNLYSRAIRKFLVPSPYIQDELVRFGIEASRISLVINPVESFEASNGSKAIEVLYAGRLSREKGIHELLAAMRLIPEVSLGIAGDGPEREAVEAATREMPNVTYFGPLPPSEIRKLISSAKIGVSASICNEILGLFPLECFVAGKRCVVSSENSSLWLTRAPFFGVAVDPKNPSGFAETFRLALAAPAVDSAAVDSLRKYLGVERFSIELEKVVKEVVG